MSTNASSPLADGQTSGHVGWMPPPRGRGTINIIWSCLTVLLICSYKCLHLNIPHEDELEAGWHKLWGAVPYWPERPALRRLLRRVKWMAIIIIAPEYGVAVAALELQRAREDLAKAVKEAPDFTMWLSERDELRRKSKLENNLFDSLPTNNPPDPLPRNNTSDSSPSNNKLTLCHAFYARIGGFVHITVDKNEGGGTRMRRTTLQSLEEYCQFLNQCDSENRSVHIRSETEIQKLVKSDHLTKVLAIAQALYLVLDCIARTNQGLPISPLELSTAAYVLAAAVMYGFWWHKPQDVAHVTELYGALEQTGLKAIGWSNKTRGYKRVRLVDRDDYLEMMFDVASLLAPYAFHLVATLFGGVHLIAWRWDFGSDGVKTAWNICAIVTSVIPLFILGIIRAFRILAIPFVDDGGILTHFCAFFILALSVCYALARAALIVLSFYTLFAMPVGVYQTVAWTDYLPFIS